VAFFNLENTLFVLGKTGKVWQHKPKGFQLLADLKGALQNPRSHNGVASFMNLRNETFWLFPSGELRRIKHPKYSEDFVIYLGEREGKMYCALYITENEKPQTILCSLSQDGIFEEVTRLPGNHCTHYLPTYDAFLNASTPNKLHLQRPSGEVIGSISIQNNLSFFIGANHITHDELWLSNRGLHLFSITKTPFSTFSLPKSFGTRGILELPNGEVLVSGSKQSYRIAKDGTLRPLPSSGGYYSVYKDRNTRTRLALLPAEDGKVWMSDELFLLLKYDPTTQTFEHFYYHTTDAEAQTKSAPYMHWALHYQASAQRLLLGHTRGISVLNKGEKVIREIKNYGSIQKLAKSEVYHFHEDTRGIWASTSTGIYLLNAASLLPEKHWPNPAESKDKSSVTLHMYPADAGAFWVATRGDGVLKWHPEKGLLRQLSRKNGLSHDVCYAVYPDDFGFLWIPTNYGLSRVDVKTGSVQVFLPKNGVSDEEFNTISHHRAKDGKLYFGGLDGLTAFHPSDFIDKSNKAPPLVLTKLLVQDAPHTPLREQTLSYQQDSIIRLSPEAEGFKVYFAQLDFKAHKKITYAYRIEGAHKDWHFTKNNFLAFYGLPYGKSTLSIKATGYPDGEAELHIPLFVMRPFYMKPWFWAMCLLLLGIFIWLLVRLRTRRLALEKEKLTQIVAERTAEIEAQAEELRKTDTLKSNFFANISHELRTPLTLILGPLKSILKQREKHAQIPASFFPTLKIAERNGQNLLRLVEEILALSKLEASKLEIHNEPEWVYAFLHHLVEHFHPQAKVQGIALFADLPAEDLSLVFDAPKLEKIVNNLLSNALKFTPPHGEVTLTARYEEGILLIEVKDSGEGIHPNDLPHIFERFFQTKQIHEKQTRGGTGIGLALSQDLARLVGGEITVESTLNEGTTFLLRYPAKRYEGKLKKTSIEAMPEVTDQQPSSEPRPLVNPPKKTYRVLLVEDNPDMQHYVQSILQPLYEVNTCYHGQEALNFLAHTPKLPDLIISDLMMPVMDGFTMLQHVKNSATWREIPLLMLTARAAEPYVLKAFRTGVNDYVTKPFSEEELHLRCKNLILNYEKRQSAKIEETLNPETSQAPSSEKEETKTLQTTFVEKLTSLIHKRIHESQLKVEDLATETSMSKSKLERTLKAETGFSPAAFIREVRLLEARRLIVDEANDFKLSYIAEQVGMKSQKNFRKLYRERFGRLPSEEV